jgi:hypothetical protein
MNETVERQRSEIQEKQALVDGNTFKYQETKEALQLN